VWTSHIAPFTFTKIAGVKLDVAVAKLAWTSGETWLRLVNWAVHNFTL
jgi:hypothetical protein